MSSRASTVLLALVCGGAVAAPIWVGEFLPLLDLPQHLALATVLMADGATESPLLRFYEPQHGELTPYWLHYVLLELVGRAVGVEPAARVLLTLYVIALPFASMELAGALGAPRRSGLLAAPLALNTNFYYGFIAYCTAVVLTLAALAVVQRQARAPRTSRAVALAVLAVVVFFTHVQALAFLLLGGAVVALLTPGAWRPRVRAAVPLLPATFLLLLWVYESTAPRADGERYFASLDEPRATYETLGGRIGGIPRAIAGAYADRTDRWLLAGWVIALGGAAAAGWKARRYSRAMLALPLTALLCTLTLPFSVQGQWNIAPRFAWVAALLAVPLATAPRAAAAAAVILSVLTGANGVAVHRRFDAEAEGFSDVVAAIPRGSRVLPLVLDATSRWVLTWPYLHFGQYAVARREAFVAHSFAANAPLPVAIRPLARVPVQGVWRADQFQPEAHAAFFDAFLVRDPAGRDPLRGRADVGPVRARGVWTLYLRTGAARSASGAERHHAATR